MGIRETLNKNQGLVTTVTSLVVLAAIILVIMQLRGGTPAAVTDKMWYTSDDGKTWFSESMAAIAPIQKDGKEAVRAYVFKCAKAKDFVMYMEKWTPEAKKILEDAKAKNELNMGLTQELRGQHLLVKKPGSGQWVAEGDLQNAYPIRNGTCPDGTRDGLEPIYAK